jgi:regulator of PEP synthase PpsR (kinase-PPPase family)
MTRQHVYLISDATGESVQTIARACAVQFEDIEVVEHLWPMVRSERALQTVIEELEAEPGLVMYTILNAKLEQALVEFCRQQQLPCISVLEPFINAMAHFFGSKVRGLPGRQHELDEDYFSRIDAINFVMAHDDGQGTTNLEDADVVLVGVSRTSKTPTSIYLANRGIKAANVPIVPDQPLPPELTAATRPLVIGLSEDPRQLVEVRRTRLRLQRELAETDYTDLERVREEVAGARRLCAQKGWPVIDVTRRSIEETAAAIIRLLKDHQRERSGAAAVSHG